MTSRPCVSAWDAMLAISAASVMSTISAMAGCTGTPQARRATPQEPGGWRSQEFPEDTRGIHPDPARLGFDHALQVRQSKNGVSHELHDGDTVMTGDRIRASIQTSEDAFLYLAFCAHQELAVYPMQGGIRTRAGELIFVPQAGAELVFDGDPGPEVLYVILSRTEISLADPKLAQALAAKRPSDTPTDCGMSLDAKLAKLSSNAGAAKLPTPSSTNVLRGAVVRKKLMSSTHARKGHGPSSSAIANTPGPGSRSSGKHRSPALTDVVPPAKAPRDPDFERNPGDIVWYRVDGATGPVDVVAADHDGIAVVRHAFTHVAQTSPP